MNNTIPTYQLNTLTGQAQDNPDIFFTEHRLNNPVASIHVPYRSNYFGIGLCVAGHAILKANLETYTVTKNCVVTMSPTVIKQWQHFSAGYKTIAVFFTRDFFIQNNLSKNFLEKFAFFHPDQKHTTRFSPKEAAVIQDLLRSIRLKLQTPHPYRYEMVRNLVEILLYETAAVYQKDQALPVPALTRSQQLAVAFKQLVCLHFAKERSVQFYASLLFVTPKHLTETVKQQTGKSAKEWIDELVILEAKVLLQDPSVQVAAVADALSFSDQAIFGKFFKNLTGLSPLAYRQSL